MAKKTTKFLTKTERQQLRRGSSAIPNNRTADPFEVKTKRLTIQQRQEVIQKRQEVTKEAQSVRQNFLDTNKTKGFTIDQILKELDNVNPIIRKRTGITKSLLVSRQNSAISDIQKKIKELDKDIEKYNKREKESDGTTKNKWKSRESGAKSEQAELRSSIRELQKGVILNVSEEGKRAQEIGNTERKKELLKLEKKAAAKKITITAAKKEPILSKAQENKFSKELNKAIVDEVQPSFRGLINSGLNNKQANFVISEYNKKVKVKDFSRQDLTKFYDTLNKNKLLTVDPTTQVQT